MLFKQTSPCKIRHALKLRASLETARVREDSKIVVSFQKTAAHLYIRVFASENISDAVITVSTISFSKQKENKGVPKHQYVGQMAAKVVALLKEQGLFDLVAKDNSAIIYALNGNRFSGNIKAFTSELILLINKK